MAEVTPQPPPTSASADPVSAIANAAGKLFDLVNTALQPSIISAQAYFQQLLNAKPSLQDPLAATNAARRQVNTIVLYAGVGVIALLIIAIIFKGRKK